MKFKKKHSNVTVFMAMLHGLLIGIAAVAIIGFVLTGTSGKKMGAKPEDEVAEKQPVSAEKETPASSSVEPLKMYARQNGAFSTPASAAAFIAEDPALATAAIIRSGDQYFVWTAVGLTENEAMEGAGEESFKKVFTATPADACEAVGTKTLRDVLAVDDLAKIKSLIAEKEDEGLAEFNKEIETITAFTNDLRVIRLHLLSQYSYSKDCIKIEF